LKVVRWLLFDVRRFLFIEPCLVDRKLGAAIFRWIEVAAAFKKDMRL
jgi:hypothetical protein